MFLLFVILLAVVAVFFWPNRDLKPLEVYKEKAKKYSGLAPEKYAEFINNLELSEQMVYSVTQSVKYLDYAIEALQDIALYAKGGSSGLREELHELASSVGDAMERLIAKTAISQGTRFHPKYMKPLQDEELEVKKIAIPTNGTWNQNVNSGLWTENPAKGWVYLDPDISSESSGVVKNIGNGDQVQTYSTGPWASQIDPVEAPLSEGVSWSQYFPKPFVDSVYNISRVMLSKSA